MAKSPGKYDSDNVLIWKYATNLWLLATAEGHNIPEPKLGSSDEVLFRRALEAAIALN